MPSIAAILNATMSRDIQSILTRAKPCDFLVKVFGSTFHDYLDGSGYRVSAPRCLLNAILKLKNAGQAQAAQLNACVLGRLPPEK